MEDGNIALIFDIYCKSLSKDRADDQLKSVIESAENRRFLDPSDESLVILGSLLIYWGSLLYLYRILLIGQCEYFHYTVSKYTWRKLSLVTRHQPENRNRIIQLNKPRWKTIETFRSRTTLAGSLWLHHYSCIHRTVNLFFTHASQSSSKSLFIVN